MTYNSATYHLYQIFGDELEVRNGKDRSVFYMHGKPIAQYKESTMTLAWYAYGKKLKEQR
jgi:hypothetical protein